MKKILLIGLLLLISSLFAAEIEVLVLSSTGSVYVKKQGKRFAESIKFDTRYGTGTLIKTDEGSTVELLTSDNSVIIIPESSSWAIGEDLTGISAREKKVDSAASLWDITFGALDRSKSSASKSNVVGSIRVAGVEEPLENVTLTSNEQLKLDSTIESILLSDDFAQKRLIALTYESYGQLRTAQLEFDKVLEIAPNDESYNQVIHFIVTMLLSADRPTMAEEYSKLIK